MLKSFEINPKIECYLSNILFANKSLQFEQLKKKEKKYNQGITQNYFQLNHLTSIPLVRSSLLFKYLQMTNAFQIHCQIEEYL